MGGLGLAMMLGCLKESMKVGEKAELTLAKVCWPLLLLLARTESEAALWSDDEWSDA